MKRSRASTWLGAALTLAVLAGLTSVPTRAADDHPFAMPRGTVFKLHVFRAEQPDKPDMVIPDGWHRPKHVDADLTDQIGKVRMALPSWTGLHHLAPGGAGGLD